MGGKADGTGRPRPELVLSRASVRRWAAWPEGSATVVGGTVDDWRCYQLLRTGAEVFRGPVRVRQPEVAQHVEHTRAELGAADHVTPGRNGDLVRHAGRVREKQQQLPRCPRPILLAEQGLELSDLGLR